MPFIADLHIHSRFSRATSKNLDFENLYMAAQAKGITVLGTGDFTHPGWLAEIKEKLVEAEQGLFKLEPKIAKNCDLQVPAACRGAVRFMLVCEISNIYKKNGITRKNHNLVFMPDLEAAEAFSARLDAIGNIKSDGRPILGLDAKHLLEIVLETSPDAFLVPAHIWTPWFSLLGSKSGFNSVSECFEELTPYIHAVETGLSSDPQMNWRVSDLDGLTLISNSDAHSASKIGREANLFNTGLSYPEIKYAIESGDKQKFLGTFEFFPEEGKYHLDGHRKCAVRLDPTETMKFKGCCPVCGKPVTKGVLYRVEELADRAVGEKPVKHHPFYNLISLANILAEILEVGPTSKRVTNVYNELLQKLGPELNILKWLPIEDIEKTGVALLGEAIALMRKGDVNILAGYDGEFGKIKLFDHKQRQALLGQLPLFAIPDDIKPNTDKTPAKQKVPPNKSPSLQNNPQTKNDITTKSIKIPKTDQPQNTFSLNEKQQEAVGFGSGPRLIRAGPGTGKTLTLTRRMAHLLKTDQAAPNEMLAITFTNKAADQLQKRLRSYLGKTELLPKTATIHGLCHQILNNNTKAAIVILSAIDRLFFIKTVINQAKNRGVLISVKPQKILLAIETAKQRLLTPADDLSEVAGAIGAETLAYIYHLYQKHLQLQNLVDFEDLIQKSVSLLENNQKENSPYVNGYKHIFVDEYQDINLAQYRLIRLLSKGAKNLCVIGDPDQSIYGFRGSDSAYFNRFESDYPDATVIKLSRNYRSTQTILRVAFDVIRQTNIDSRLLSAHNKSLSKSNRQPPVTIFGCASAKAEAVVVGKTIEKLVGGTGFHSIDFGKVDDSFDNDGAGFADIAVLYRTHEQSRTMTTVFGAAGIPYQVASRKNLFEQKSILEILSLFRILLGCGSQADFSRIISEIHPGIQSGTWDIFLNWWCKNGYDLPAAMENAVRFPISNLSRTRQENLVNFLTRLDQLRGKTNDLTVHQILLYLFDHVKSAAALKQDQKKREAWVKLLELAKPYGQDKQAFGISCTMGKDTDVYDPHAQKVSLLTMHAAKGLEFPVVFVVGCEDDYVPFRKNPAEDIDISEECRLFYVAVTRAKSRLYLSFANHRTINGQNVTRTISPFVKAINSNLVEYDQKSGAGPRPKQTQLSLFE
jgi:DNA helicase II / ATP-dependent DNA helicase PcrA